MWIYVDKNLVLATNPNDMSGNTGWVEYDGEIAWPLFDEYDVPMYAFENGILRERTEEEREVDRPEPEHELSNSERILNLETAVEELQIIDSGAREIMDILEGNVE